MKLVINKCYGGFSLSPVAVKKLAELEGKEHAISNREYERHDPTLVQVVEELEAGAGMGASGSFAQLEIVEIPDGVE